MAETTFRTEFPDFDPATLPDLPPAFEDVSWRNDACPSFFDEAGCVTLYVDHADSALREFQGDELGERFSLHWTAASGDLLAVLTRGLRHGQTDFFGSDDFAEVLKAYERARRVVMGVTLADLLRDSLEAADLDDCAAGRADPCDFIDDNECTADAYAATFGSDLTGAFGTADEDQALARANVATVVAARLLRGQQPTCAELLAMVARDFPRGLCHTITRRGAFESNLRQCLEG